MNPTESCSAGGRAKCSPTTLPIMQKRYLFIEGVGSSYSSSVRAHVLQRYKEERKNRASSRRAGARKPDHSKKYGAQSRGAGHPAENDEMVKLYDTQPGNRIVERLSPCVPSQRGGPATASSSLQLRSIFKPDQMDPFSVFARKLGLLEKKLVHHCMEALLL